MPKKFFTITSTLLALMLALAVIVSSGCAAPTPTSSPAEATPTPSPAKPIKLIASCYHPPSYADLFPPQKEFCERVNEIGKGTVEVDFYHSGNLLKAGEAIPGLRKGTADLIFQTSAYWTGDVPIYNGYSLPFLWEDYADMRDKLFRGTPLRELVDKEMAKSGYYIVAEGALPMEHIWAAKGISPIRKPADLKGLKVRAAGKPESRTAMALGGAPVRMPSAEVHEAAARGTIDACMFYMGTVGGRALYEVLDSCTKATFGAYTVPAVMMKDRWEKLPEDVRDILLEVGDWYEKEYPGHASKVHNEQYWPKFEEAGAEIIELSSEEEKAFRETCKPVYDWFTEEECPEVGEKFVELASE